MPVGPLGMPLVQSVSLFYELVPVPAGGGTFLLRQESTQRMRLKRGAKAFAPANTGALS